MSFRNRRSFLYHEVGSPYWKAYTAGYGILPKFWRFWEATSPTADGPQLAILFETVQP
jgi:hypothetical protein